MTELERYLAENPGSRFVTSYRLRTQFDTEAALDYGHLSADVGEPKARSLRQKLMRRHYRRLVYAEVKHLEPGDRARALLLIVPACSDRWIAGLIDASPMTVGRERRKLEAAGRIPAADVTRDSAKETACESQKEMCAGEMITRRGTMNVGALSPCRRDSSRPDSFIDSEAA